MILRNELLRIVRAVEILPSGVLTRPSVVTTNDEMGGTKVLANDSVPEGFTGTAHTHSEGKKCEVAHTVGIAGHDGFVDTDAGVVVNIAGLGETDDGVDEDVCLAIARGTDGEFAMGAMHGVARLEGDDLAPCELGEVRTELGGGIC